MTTVPVGVGRTALGAALVRAMESRRRDRLFDDPYAAAFVAAAPAVFRREDQGTAAFVGGVSRKAAGFWTQAVLRTRFFDDYVLAAAAAGIGQIVLVAAGLDTRPYRLRLPAGVRVFEVDRPDVLDFKHHVLRARGAVPPAGHRSVPADLRFDWRTPLLDAGLSTGLPTAWLLEGLLIYLTSEEVVGLLSTLHELSAPDSRASFEAGDLQVAAAAGVPAIAEYAALWKGGLPDPGGWLAGRGWDIETVPENEIAARYGRPAAGGFTIATRSRDA